MNGPEEYLETQVMTATPHQLHMMVIDGAIRFATQAEEALQEDDFETAHFALNRSREFVTEVGEGVVTVNNALSKIIRLQQVTSGFLPVYDPDTGDKITDEKGDVLVSLGGSKQSRLSELIGDLDSHEPGREPVARPNPDRRSRRVRGELSREKGRALQVPRVPSGPHRELLGADIPDTG